MTTLYDALQRRRSRSRIACGKALFYRSIERSFIYRTCDSVDQRSVERWQVARVAARHELLIRNDGPVYPVAAGVLDVRPKTGVRRERAAAQAVRLDEQPRPMADRANRLVGVHE